MPLKLDNDQQDKQFGKWMACLMHASVYNAHKRGEFKINILCVNVIILFAQFMNLKNPSKLKQQLSQQHVLALDKRTALCHEQRSIRYL